jgi:hypothetical protein
LTSLPADSLASHSVLPGSAEARRITVISGRKCSVLSKSAGPVGCLVRMCLGSSEWNSMRVYLRWKVRATKQGRLLFQLAPWTRRTDGTEFGLWPTARSRDWKGQTQRGKHAPMDGLPNAVAANLWPTARATDGNKGSRTLEGSRREMERGRNIDLGTAVKLWPTPHASCGTGASRTQQGGMNLQTFVAEMESPAGHLNPRFVEWLMGYPDGWTDLNA